MQDENRRRVAAGRFGDVVDGEGFGIRFGTDQPVTGTFMHGRS
jgi:hypothetical protein